MKRNMISSKIKVTINLKELLGNQGNAEEGLTYHGRYFLHTEAQPLDQNFSALNEKFTCKIIKHSYPEYCRWLRVILFHWRIVVILVYTYM